MPAITPWKASMDANGSNGHLGGQEHLSSFFPSRTAVIPPNQTGTEPTRRQPLPTLILPSGSVDRMPAAPPRTICPIRVPQCDDVLEPDT
ncbi:uncharacterized protein N7498_003855 [Penicillium cinerascens]|uniref:Uncharacterized protein n=1 Tax=Penicillium cinerascens TaxID=70096 RepID=A0A9W9T7I7_9EURO|nr:uncharacterized protein N7498_003855 [Penicillium cinerascens]KAJ5212209.1 hypothetical protein N7498_003855 [Penicillium cinerascens]